MTSIFYCEGYKYQLKRDYIDNLGLGAPSDILTEYTDYLTTGEFIIKHGYAWDGPSGPTFDTPDSMRGALIHDALYQLMREGLLDPDSYREVADKILRRICMEDGMSEVRADAWYEAVRLFAASAADPKNAKPELSAP